MKRVSLTESQLHRVIAESVRRVMAEGWNEEMFDKMNNASNYLRADDYAGQARIKRAKDYLAHRYLRDNNLTTKSYKLQGYDAKGNPVYEPADYSNQSNKQFKAMNRNYKSQMELLGIEHT